MAANRPIATAPERNKANCLRTIDTTRECRIVAPTRRGESQKKNKTKEPRKKEKEKIARLAPCGGQPHGTEKGTAKQASKTPAVPHDRTASALAAQRHTRK